MIRRWRFVGRAAALLRGVTVACALVGPWGAVGCGGDDDGATTVPDAAVGAFTITNDDDSGHTHELVIECGDLAAGLAMTVIATGPHSHTVMITADQVQMIADGETVTISFTDGHSHTFVIVKPPGAC